MTGVMIGIDPHKGSHTAVALDEAETLLGKLRVIAREDQVEVLRGWARRWPQRTWAIEGARGLGQLLAAQLIGAGEPVVDVAPKLAARVRLLNTGQINKNDPNDARSVAVAALRAPNLPLLTGEDYTAVLRVWASRYRNLSRLRTQAICRLHAVLGELLPGGARRDLSAGQVILALEDIVADTPIAQAKLELAHDLLADLQRLDAQRQEVRRRAARAIAAAPTTLTEIYGVGPIVAATVLGYVRDVRRFGSRDGFASYNGTAPIEVSSGERKVYRLSRRGNRQLNHALHMAALTQIRRRGTEGRAYYDRKISEGMARKAALRALKRRISDALYARMLADSRRASEDPGGHSGNDTSSSVAGSHPDTPALRTSHSRAEAHPTTKPDRQLGPRPAPDRRAPRRSATGVKVEPRTSPHRGRGQGTTLTPASTGRQSPRRSRPTSPTT
ncbi:MAG TPA: IS110 family transposase [Solirubrobacteraceae bacterium]|nr:IS110 family transposase [Solirubrobacteraceae bacterium]